MSGAQVGQYTDGDDVIIKGGTDSTSIGNIGNRLMANVDGSVTVADTTNDIDDGAAFTHSHTHSAGNGVVVYHLMITPDTAQRIYLSYDVSSLGSTVVDFYEAPTVTANGSTGNTFNRNRNSSDTTPMAIYHGPTVTADGTLIDRFELGASGGSKPGSGGSLYETVLAQNTKYLLKYTSNASGNVISERLFWRVK